MRYTCEMPARPAYGPVSSNAPFTSFTCTSVPVKRLPSFKLAGYSSNTLWTPSSPIRLLPLTSSISTRIRSVRTFIVA
jgi:hypothetical protein